MAPHASWARLRLRLADAGITRVANVTGLDCIGIPVVMVCRPNSRSLSVSQGKGLSLSAARVSGVMESLETHAAERPQVPVRRASYDRLSNTHAVVHPRELCHTERSTFTPDGPMSWTVGRDLLSGEEVWVPYESVTSDFRVGVAEVTGAVTLHSTGLASGNAHVEAVSHALCEVIERDATGLWELRDWPSQRITGVDLGSVREGVCRSLLRRLDRAQVDVAVWNATSDIGVPCFVCRILDRAVHDPRGVPHADGAGCHPSREVALMRAITEAVQSRLTLISGARDDMFRATYAQLRNPRAMRSQRLAVRAGPRPVDFNQIPSFEFPTFETEITWLLERIEGVGVKRIVAVDLTHPSAGVPVVRIVVPGLEDPLEAHDYVWRERGRSVMGR